MDRRMTAGGCSFRLIAPLAFTPRAPAATPAQHWDRSRNERHRRAEAVTCVQERHRSLADTDLEFPPYGSRPYALDHAAIRPCIVHTRLRRRKAPAHRLATVKAGPRTVTMISSPLRSRSGSPRRHARWPERPTDALPVRTPGAGRARQSGLTEAHGRRRPQGSRRRAWRLRTDRE